MADEGESCSRSATWTCLRRLSRDGTRELVGPHAVELGAEGGQEAAGLQESGPGVVGEGQPTEDDLEELSDLTGADVYEVEKVLGHQFTGRPCLHNLQIRVKWLNYGSENNSFEPLVNISHHLLARYARTKKGKVIQKYMMEAFGQ